MSVTAIDEYNLKESGIEQEASINKCMELTFALNINDELPSQYHPQDHTLRNSGHSRNGSSGSTGSSGKIPVHHVKTLSQIIELNMTADTARNREIILSSKDQKQCSIIHNDNKTSTNRSENSDNNNNSREKQKTIINITSNTQISTKMGKTNTIFGSSGSIEEEKPIEKPHIIDIANKEKIINNNNTVNLADLSRNSTIQLAPTQQPDRRQICIDRDNLDIKIKCDKQSCTPKCIENIYNHTINKVFICKVCEKNSKRGDQVMVCYCKKNIPQLVDICIECNQSYENILKSIEKDEQEYKLQSKQLCNEALKSMQNNCQSKCRISDKEYILRIALLLIFILTIAIGLFFINQALGGFLLLAGIIIVGGYISFTYKERRKIIGNYKQQIPYFTIVKEANSSEFCDQCQLTIQQTNDSLQQGYQHLIN